MNVLGRHRDIIHNVEGPPPGFALLTGRVQGHKIRVDCLNNPEFWLEIELTHDDIYAIANARMTQDYEENPHADIAKDLLISEYYGMPGDAT